MIQLHGDHRGKLGVFEFADLPFVPKRAFWISQVPTNETRGNHAHHHCQQFIVILQGTVECLIITNQRAEKKEKLKIGDYVHLPAYHWITLDTFSLDAVVLVICSDVFDENDYIRTLQEFYLTK